MDVQLIDVPTADCDHSRFNTRKTRPAEQVERLAERIARNGFERTRALWAVQAGERYEVFAGGTRLEAARKVGLLTVPVMLHTGAGEEEIARRADEDNENDEYHTKVPLLDVWAEFSRLWKEEGWTQQRIAEAKGCPRQLVVNRCAWHRSLPKPASAAVSDGLLNEGHCEAISSLLSDVGHLQPWLTTEQAQTELVQEVLGKHRGKTADIAPTVPNVREAAKRWKALIAAAEAHHAALDGEAWQKAFAARLASTKARTLAAVDATYRATIVQKEADEQRRANEARAAASEADARAVELAKESARVARVEAFTRRVLCGDAREQLAAVTGPVHLLLTDPPYGQAFQSNRRVASAKKPQVANDDDAEQAVALFRDVLAAASGKFADDCTVLVFAGWRHEPLFRAAVEGAGFTIKGSLIWDKPNHGTGDLKGSFAPKHERIIHAVRGNVELRKRHPDVLQGAEFLGTGHPTEKPLDLLRALVEATTDPGHVVLDPFAGGGSAVFAAHAAGRQFWAVELEVKWHRVLVDKVHEVASREGQQP